MWIAVDDRLPTTTGNYFVTLQVGSMRTKNIVTIKRFQVQEHYAKFSVGDWQKVLGWQELPEPMGK